MPDKPREISKNFTVQAYIHGPYRTLRDLLKYPKLSERLKYRWLGNRDRDANRQTALIGWLMVQIAEEQLCSLAALQDRLFNFRRQNRKVCRQPVE